MNTSRSTHSPTWCLIVTSLLIGITALLPVSCTKSKPVLVGFAGQLSGVQAELGVQERNGVQLAFSEINAAGGIDRRQVELLVQDDLGTPQGAQAADSELIKANVVAIIGHPTSAQTLAGVLVTNPAKVVMLSPSTSTPALTGKDDYFFRIVQTMTAQATHSAKYLYNDRNLRRVAVIYDTVNAAYTTAYLDAFAAEYNSLGGKVVAKTSFSSKNKPDLIPLIKQLRTNNPDFLLIIAPDIDAALIAQRVRSIDWQIPLFTTSWAQTETLINNGGKAVEGMEIELISAVSSKNPEYRDFTKRYEDKFGRSPSFGAVLGYEAAQVLAAALQKTGGKAEGLKPALLGIKKFRGLSDEFGFDKYGDAVRPIHLGVIRDGKYVSIGTAKPSGP